MVVANTCFCRLANTLLCVPQSDIHTLLRPSFIIDILFTSPPRLRARTDPHRHPPTQASTISIHSRVRAPGSSSSSRSSRDITSGCRGLISLVQVRYCADAASVCQRVHACFAVDVLCSCLCCVRTSPHPLSVCLCVLQSDRWWVRVYARTHAHTHRHQTAIWNVNCFLWISVEFSHFPDA